SGSAWRPSVAEGESGVLTVASDAQNRGLLLEAGTVVGAGGMRQVMLDRLQLDLLQIESQLLQAPLDAFPVAVVTAVAHENGIQRAVRRIPVALGVMPAGLLEDADGCEGNGDDIHVRRSDSGLLQAEFGRLVGHA